MHSSLVLYLGLTSLVAKSVLSHHDSIPVAHLGCGTAAPSEDLKYTYSNLSNLDELSPEADDERQFLSPIYVDTWFHIVSSTASSDFVTNEMIKSQFAYLKAAYANTSISYRLIGIDRTLNDSWASNEDDIGMKKSLRRGTYNTLNIYFQTDLKSDPSAGPSAGRAVGTSTSSSQPASNLLGFCTLPNPKITASSPPLNYVEDGCNVLAASMPGGPISHYNLGGTDIHEVGHWNGLLHTFQGETCDPNSPGDYIADTPIQSVPTDGCPQSKDSCPKDPGLDAIHNFMDYSSDDCYQSFTTGQARRMRDMWYLMRAGK